MQQSKGKLLQQFQLPRSPVESFLIRISRSCLFRHSMAVLQVQLWLSQTCPKQIFPEKNTVVRLRWNPGVAFTFREQSLQVVCRVPISFSASLLGGGTYLAPTNERPELINSTIVGEASVCLVRNRSVMGKSMFVTGGGTRAVPLLIHRAILCLAVKLRLQG